MNDLIKKAKAGDERAFTKLIQNIQNDLYRVAQSKLSDNDDINDAIQNTMMNAYRHLKKLKDNDMFKSWIIKILVNECNRIYKMKFKRRKLFQKIKIESVKSETQDYSINKINSKIDFEKVLEMLNADERLIIVLYYNSKYSCSEIADILNMNKNTVKSMLIRTRQKIKEIYIKGGIYNG